MFAKGKKALGICDTCGQEWKLNRLRYQAIAGRTTRVRVCPECYDEDQPQLRPDKWMTKGEAIALRDPRPDPARAGMNSLGGFGPVLGCEIAVAPCEERWVMADFSVEAPIYILTEDAMGRLITEDGRTLDTES